jgi:hypothetical protein
MVAMTILMVGLLGMMHFQILGISANGAARMHTLATELAQEMVSGIERLPFGDPLLAATGSSGPGAPTPFGRLLVPPGREVTAGAHEWNDATPIPGVRPAGGTGFVTGPEGWRYERRWSVWGYSPSAGGLPTVKLVAVSVVYREPLNQLGREVVLYTQLFDPAALITNIPANQ